VCCNQTIKPCKIRYFGTAFILSCKSFTDSKSALFFYPPAQVNDARANGVRTRGRQEDQSAEHTENHANHHSKSKEAPAHRGAMEQWSNDAITLTTTVKAITHSESNMSNEEQWRNHANHHSESKEAPTHRGAMDK
jgi:hypothetical protein